MIEGYKNELMFFLFIYYSINLVNQISSSCFCIIVHFKVDFYYFDKCIYTFLISINKCVMDTCFSTIYLNILNNWKANKLKPLITSCTSIVS